MEKKITVLMSEHNTNALQLKKAIESILKQTYKEFIFIIVDDFTNEENKKVLLEYSLSDDRIKIIKNEENLGLVKSLNRGIENISTEYIARMDSDDIAEPERLQKQIEFMENNNQYAFCGTRANYFDENGVYLKSTLCGEIGINILVRFCAFFHPSIMIRTSILKELGKYEEYTRNEDYALYLKLYYKGFKGYILKDILLNYRQDKDAYKRKKYCDRIIEYRVRKKYFKLLKIPYIKRCIYTVKPLIVGLIPKFLISNYKRIRNAR